MSPKQSKAAYRRDLLPSVSKPLTTLKGDKIFRASRGFKMARVVSDFFFSTQYWGQFRVDSFAAYA